LFTAGVITIASLAIARRMVPFRIGMQVVWTGIAATAIVAFAVFMKGRMSMLHLLSLKAVLLSSLGIVYVLRFRSTSRDLVGAVNRGD